MESQDPRRTARQPGKSSGIGRKKTASREGRRGAGLPGEGGLAVWFLRAIHNWKQKELAEASGVHKAMISLYETGREVPSRATLARLALGAGFPLPFLDLLLPVFRAALSAGDLLTPAASPEDGASVAAEVARVVADALLVAMADLPLIDPAASPRTVAAERASAPARWALLEAFEPEEQRFLVEHAEEHRSFAVCELVCEKSVEAAPNGAARALELAELALFIAERAVEGETWRARLRGYALAFVGNARRVAGDLQKAEQAFERARSLWEAGAAADLGVLDASRVLDLEASLLRARRRFAEALTLLDRALGRSPSRERTAHMLLNKTAILEQMGDCEGTIAALRQAAPLVDGGREPRQLFGLRFNLAVNLCHLGRHAEAAPLVAEARELAVALRNEIDLLRVLWLEARVAAGLGRGREAVAALRQVRRDFADRELAYDAALATLDLAVLLLEENENAEVRSLAGEMVTVFESLEVHREALAAVRLFWRAVEQETATAELGRRLLRFLERARHDSELRFKLDPPGATCAGRSAVPTSGEG